MLGNKQQKIYIVIIAVAVLGIIFVLILNRQAPSLPSDAILNPLPTASTPARVFDQTVGQTYSPPLVFPADTKFDQSVLSSSAFKLLKPYAPLTVDKTDLGRDNPFNPY